MEMISRALASTMIGAACLLGAASVNAQTGTTQTNTYDQCRDEAVRRGISGAGLNEFLNECMRQQPASGSVDRRASYDRCRSDGVARGLSGDALYNSVSDCLQRSGATGSDSMTGTFNECRSQGRARGLIGAAFDEFLDACITR
jgi:hypothetical protein